MAVVTWGSLSLRTPHIGDIGLLIFQWDILHASGEKTTATASEKMDTSKMVDFHRENSDFQREIFGYPIFISTQISRDSKFIPLNLQ